MAITDFIKTFFNRFRKPKHRPKGDFVLRRRFELTVKSLTSQKKVIDLKMRKWSFIMFAILLFLAIGAFWVVAFIYTPLRNTLPMRLQTDLRDEYVNLSVRLDSISTAASITDAYMQNILAILGDSVYDQEPNKEDVLPEIPIDSLMESSDAERAFVNRFESSERYNLSVLSPIAAEGMSFVPPTHGTSLDVKVTDAGIPYAVIIGGKSIPVSSIYRGTVTNIYYTNSKGITVVIQHPNDFLSIYSGLSEVFVSRGDKVRAGTRIGIAGNQAFSLTFELWHNGAPLPPDEYIPFNK